MNKATLLLRQYFADESGATALEYALLCGLIGVALTVGASKLALNNDSAWNNMAAKVENVG